VAIENAVKSDPARVTAIAMIDHHDRDLAPKIEFRRMVSFRLAIVRRSGAGVRLEVRSEVRSTLVTASLR
jgi:hypothetical protein